MNHIAQHWETVASNLFLVPGTERYGDLQKAFYAGALAAFNEATGMDFDDDDPEPTEKEMMEGVAKLEAIRVELHEFAHKTMREARR